MSDVSFNEEQFTRQAAASAAPRGLTGWFIAHKFAKTQTGALVIQLVVIVVAAGIAIGVSFWGKGNAANSLQEKRLNAWMQSGHTGAPPANYNP